MSENEKVREVKLELDIEVVNELVVAINKFSVLLCNAKVVQNRDMEVTKARQRDWEEMAKDLQLKFKESFKDPSEEESDNGMQETANISVDKLYEKLEELSTGMSKLDEKFERALKENSKRDLVPILKELFSQKSSLDNLSTEISKSMLNARSDDSKEEFELNIADGEKLKPASVSFKESFHLQIDNFARSKGWDMAEFFRRASFAALKNPASLKQVEYLENQYKSKLGRSRHHE